MSNYKVAVQQFKGNGFINLIPMYSGKWLFKYTVTVFPSCYHRIKEYSDNIKKEVLSISKGDE